MHVSTWTKHTPHIWCYIPEKYVHAQCFQILSNWQNQLFHETHLNLKLSLCQLHGVGEFVAGLPFGKLLTFKSKEQNHIAQYGVMCHLFSTMKGLCLRTAKECCRFTSVANRSTCWGICNGTCSILTGIIWFEDCCRWIFRKMKSFYWTRDIWCKQCSFVSFHIF